MKTQWMSSTAQRSSDDVEHEERFVVRFQHNLESWRTGEIDHTTFIECNREIWDAISVAALVYELAAHMERLSHPLEAHWTIAPDADRGEVVIELAGDHEAALADEFITNVMLHHQLI